MKKEYEKDEELIKYKDKNVVIEKVEWNEDGKEKCKKFSVKG
jgi:hypothetical protein